MYTSVLSMLDNAASRYQEKVIFQDMENQLTFGEFDRMTKSIGSWLAERVCSGSPVSVLSGRNLITPVSYLGVVRAGCFYAPMDATMPKARLNQILSVVNSEIMLVDREHFDLAKSLEYKGEIKIIEEISDSDINEDLIQSATAGLTEYSPLYVIFTSGSSGIPKGVITSHYSLMCYLDGLNDVIEMDENDVIGSQSPLDYIAAIRDIYLPLMSGAKTVIIPKHEFAMGGRLFEILNEYKVTTICWSAAGMEVPAKLGAFEERVPRYLKKVVFSGSVLPGKYLKIWQENLPDVKFVNQYGPTEATASCTYYVVKETATNDTVLSIGKPFKHYGIIMLSEDDKEVPRGEVGEICVTGPGLALGYYGSPEQTEKAFIQNPLNDKYRELIYKSGDLGRIEEDGNLTFLGRKDRQIKHMGHRIELAEIEMIAMQLSDVDECCSLYDSEKKHLYLFYVGEISDKETILHFRKVVPPFMVPRKVIKLNEMPRLPNGKLDMQKLKAYFK